MEHSEIIKKVEANIGALADYGVEWALPVPHEEIESARRGELLLPPYSRPIPRDWLPDQLAGVKALCLAGAGGLQGPLLAAAGADVTVFDLSEKMLERDRLVMEREGLDIRLERGDMCDLSRFSDGSFELIINPPSLFYIEDVHPVFRECARVLKTGGILIVQAPSPVNYMCEYVPDGGYYELRNTLPYKSYEHDDQSGWIEFGHTLEDYIGGQTTCGFAITGFYEDGDGLADSGFVTRAVKL